MTGFLSDLVSTWWGTDIWDIFVCYQCIKENKITISVKTTRLLFAKSTLEVILHAFSGYCRCLHFLCSVFNLCQSLPAKSLNKWDVSGEWKAQLRSSLMQLQAQDFLLLLQVQYQGLFQMVIVLGIGGTFQIGFQISTITYMNQVGKSSHSRLVNGITNSTSLSWHAPLR